MRVFTSLLCTIALAPSLAFSQSSRTQIVMLGTGTPIPDPDRSGPAVAIVVDSVAYLFDAGAGRIGKYSACSFRSMGTGTFFGEEGTNPTVGKSGRLERADELRLLDRAWQEARSGAGSVVVLAGESGIGRRIRHDEYSKPA